MEKEKSCGAVVINNEKKILLVLQNTGHYSFPKGHVESGESEQMTAIRETKEETNIDIEIINNKRFTLEYLVKDNIPKEVVYFLARPISFELQRQPDEISEVLWVSIEDVPQYLTFDNIKTLWYEEIIKEIEKTML